MIDKDILVIENMGEDEENIPDLAGISRSLQKQHRVQELTQKLLDNERNARSSMENPLKGMEEMLKLLVGQINQIISCGSTGTNTSNTTTVTKVVQSTLQSAETVRRSAISGAETHVTNGMPGWVNSTVQIELQSVSSMAAARSSAYVQIPKFTEGMNFIRV